MKSPLSRRVMILGAITLACVELIATLVGDRGYLQVRRRRAAWEDLAAQVTTMQQENDALLTQIRALRTDPTTVERLAREQLGYAKPGEVIYLFPR